MAGNSAEGIRWDLSDLFASHDDPRIEETLDACRTEAESFALRFKGRLSSLAAGELLSALKEMEEIQDALSRVATYASLLYCADSLKPEYQDLDQKVEQRATEIQNLLLFFDLEWLALDDRAAERFIRDPALKNYVHYLTSLRRFRPHKLSEPEEKIVNEKDTTGRSAFGRLFSEITSALTFPLEKDGKTEELTLSEMLALLHEPDREVRRRALETVYDGLSAHGPTLTFIYDTLVQDHLTMDRLRRYPDPMLERHLVHEIDGAAVGPRMAGTGANYGIAQDYFKLKARLLNLPRLALYDQYAPVGAEAARFPLPEAERIVFQAFNAFSPIFRETAAEFFAKRWIDAEVRKGKRGGAFCASPSPKLHPYILCNYTDTLRDVMTVAHELGHGLHGCLSRRQTFFNYDTPLTTAETASVFGEMLVFDYLVERQTDPKIQIALLAGKLEDTFATGVRQNLLSRFREKGVAKPCPRRLPPETVRNLM